MFHQRRWATPLILVLSGLLGTASARTPFEQERTPNSTVVRSIEVQARTLELQALDALPNDPATALKTIREATALVGNDHSPELLHGLLTTQAEAEFALGLFDEFQRTTLHAIEVGRTLGDPMTLSLDLRGLSKAYACLLQPDKAIKEARNALAILLPIGEPEAVEEARMFLMRTLIEAGKPEEARGIGAKALADAPSRISGLTAARLRLCMAEALVANDAPAEALALANQAAPHIDVEGSASDRFLLGVIRTKAALELGMNTEAARMLDRITGQRPPGDGGKHGQQLLSLRYELALARKQWAEALQHLQDIKAFDDSVRHAQLDARMAGLQVIYELEAHERANAELREANARQNVTITDQRAHNNYLLFILSTLAVLSVGLLLLVRLYRRMSARLEAKNTLIRSQHDEIHAMNLELQRQNMRLSEALISEEEKDMMIKEIHHRVKNNLQVVDSLLSLEGVQRDDPAAGRMFKEAQGRIRSMALVHEHIYRSSGNNRDPLSGHLLHLSRSVLVSYGMQDRISVDIDCSVPALPVDVMMPLTLLVNELLTNAIKHAFVDRDKGQVRIAVRPYQGGYELLFTDDGIGIQRPENASSGSFGMELMNMLAEQLNGRLEMPESGHNSVRLRFSPDAHKLRIAS